MSGKKIPNRENKYKIVYERDKGICHICLTPVVQYKGTLDHIIPRSEGGLHGLDNLKLAHAKCNSYKSNAKPYRFIRYIKIKQETYFNGLKKCRISNTSS